MCRLLGIWSSVSDQLTAQKLYEDWLTSWRKSAQNDPHLKIVVPQEYLSLPGALEHNHGWGVVAMGAGLQESKGLDFEVKNLSFYKTLTSLSETPHVEMVQVVNTPSFLSAPQQVLLAHVRKASPSMPVTHEQVHPMLILKDSANSDYLFLAHNGGVNKTIINNMLEPGYKLSEEQFNTVSDTQLLSVLVKQELDRQASRDDLFNTLWVPLIRRIRKEHEEQDKNYSMMIYLLHRNQSKLEYTIINDYRDTISYKQPYYQLYLVRKENAVVVCSSTVKEYYEQDYGLEGWEVKALENHSVLHFQRMDLFTEFIER